MTGIIDIKRIKIGVSASSKEDVLKQISSLAFKSQIVNSEEEYLEGLIDREAEFTTGTGKGFAIPHCKSATVNKASAIVFKLNNDVDWQSMDDKPVNFVIALAIPESDATTTHLKILSQIARCLMDEDFTEKLNNTQSENEIYNLLSERIEGGK